MAWIPKIGLKTGSEYKAKDNRKSANWKIKVSHLRILWEKSLKKTGVNRTPGLFTKSENAPAKILVFLLNSSCICFALSSKARAAGSNMHV